MHATNCLNCQFTLQGEENFCPNCGQKTGTHRLTWEHFFHEAWHAFTHTDKGLLNVLKGLAINPGLVVSEFVEGKYKKYFNPITFLFLCLGLFVLANSIFKPYVDFPKPDPKVIALLKTEEQKKQYLGFFERSETAATFQQKHPNIIAMIGFPLEAFIFWAFFRRRRRNYVEVLIAIIFLGGFSNLIFTFIFSPLLGLAKHTDVYNWLLIGVLLTMVLYTAWGMKGFLTNPQPIAYWKPMLVAVLHMLIWTLLITVFFLWYVLRDQSVEGIKKILKI